MTALLPFLVGYSRSHLLEERTEEGLADLMGHVSVREKREMWTGSEALR